MKFRMGNDVTEIYFVLVKKEHRRFTQFTRFTSSEKDMC